MARKRIVEPDPEDMRKDLLAALAAARELGPEMDTAIVDSHLRRHFGEASDQTTRAVQPATPATPAPAQRPDGPSVLAAIYPLAGLAAVAAIAIVIAVAGWHAFPLFFFLWPLFAWGVFGRRRMWRQYGQWDGYRYGRRWGDGSDDGRGPRDDGMMPVAYQGGDGRGRLLNKADII